MKEDIYFLFILINLHLFIYFKTDKIINFLVLFYLLNEFIALFA